MNFKLFNKSRRRPKRTRSSSKPFYRGEFSLEDLRVINPIFNGIANEDIAFQYLTSNINEAE